MKMGKKRKFNRFIRWIKSDLPNDNKSVLLLGVTKLPSPTPIRARPHTLHLDDDVLASPSPPPSKSQTLDNQPRLKSRLFRSHSGDSLNELLTAKIITLEKRCCERKPAKIQINQNAAAKSLVANNRSTVVVKKVQFEPEWNANSCLNSTCFNSKSAAGGNPQKLGYCVEQPYDYYHPNNNSRANLGRITNEGGGGDTTTPDFMMDKSVDSIGSCSLDVDASSTDFSDSSVGSSDCTLRSLGIPTPTTQKQPSFHLKTENFDTTERKKPSYLNLACTVNGYSNITNYDSKLRENFRIPRSREVSPIRPQDYHAQQQPPPSNIIEKATFLSPPQTSTNFTKTMLNSPSKKMSESKSQTLLRNATTTNSYSSSYTTKKIIYSSSSDTVDQASSYQTNTNTNMKFTSSNTSKISFSSTLNGKSETYETYINGTTQQNGEKSKSFIQQRVERLYGPGALAQGFFITKRTKNRISECSENGDLNTSFTNGNEPPKSPECEVNLKQSTSSPQLPVLRHLRPEFRAQLPILSPKRMPNENSTQKSTTITTNSVPLSPPLTITANGTGDAKLINGIIIMENKENIDKQLITNDVIKPPVKLTDIITEEIPAAPQVVLPVPVVTSVSVSNGNIKLNGTSNGVKEEIKDGHYFLKILKNEQDRLIKLAVIAEAELEENITKMSDEQLGYLRSASGKARLLVNQKMQQFEGLCHKNINKIDGEQFPTTTEDLQGFWDMVMLQVVQIDELFAELDRIRANNWIIEEKPKPELSDSLKTTKKLVVVKKAVSAKAEAERKQREAARKKMIEDRRKAMRAKQQQQQQPEEQSIEIFVPESS